MVIEETELNANCTAGAKYLADLERQLERVLETDPDSDLFGEMRFVISGFSDRHRRQIEGALRNNGGFVFDKISASITHVILSRDGVQATFFKTIFYKKQLLLASSHF